MLSASWNDQSTLSPSRQVRHFLEGRKLCRAERHGVHRASNRACPIATPTFVEHCPWKAGCRYRSGKGRKTRPDFRPFKCSRSISAKAGSTFTVLFPLFVLTETSCPRHTATNVDAWWASWISPNLQRAARNTSPGSEDLFLPSSQTERATRPVVELTIFRISSSVRNVVPSREPLEGPSSNPKPAFFSEDESQRLPTTLRLGFW